VRIAIEHIDASAGVDDVAAQLAALPVREREALGPRATTKRCADFAAGRRAARAALALLVGDTQALTIERTRAGEHLGEPIVTGMSPAPCVSITHADDTALAVASWQRVGIDVTHVVPLRERGDAFVAEAFVAGELNAWLALDLDRPLAIARAFAAKEAVLKWRGVGFGEALLAFAVLPQQRIQEPRVIDTVSLASIDVHVVERAVTTKMALGIGLAPSRDRAVICVAPLSSAQAAE
jgi:4'-phosphopantetheinyl transferase EntD